MHIDALIHTFRLLDIADILIVAVGIYYLYKLLKDTRAVSLLKGLVVMVWLFARWQGFLSHHDAKCESRIRSELRTDELW